MTRILTGHKVNPANDILEVVAVDGPGPGGASHVYTITAPNVDVKLEFQNGPIAETGVNGITQEALLTILIDRLEGFQSGQFNCFENDQALKHLRAAQEILHKRTKERMARGVEGTHQV